MSDRNLTDLQTQIESIYNTKDFERLVNELFSRIFGTDYVPMDYHKDGGCDGYISSSQTLIAKHCFENLVPRKDNRNSKILEKARDDLKKALVLSKSQKLKIKKWMFLTPYLIPGNVYVQLKKEVENDGFEFECPGPSYIAVNLLKNKDLIQSFPFLYVWELDESVKEIAKQLESTVTSKQIKESQSIVEKSKSLTVEETNKVVQSEKPKLNSSVLTITPKKLESKDFKRVLEIFAQPPNSVLEKEVKSIIYSSSDEAAVLQAVHLLASWYKFSRETVDDQLTFIDLGIDAAKNLKSLDSEAVLLAEKGNLLSTKFVLLDLEGWGQIQMSNATGFPIITSEQRESIIKKLKELNQEFNRLFKDAMEKAYASNSYSAITKTFMRIGDSAGSRAGHFMNLGINDRAQFEQRLSKGSFMHAKKVAVQFNDEVELAYVLYNFANALGFMDETDEALKVLDEALKLAKKHKMIDILSTADRLIKLIKEPKIKLQNL